MQKVSKAYKDSMKSSLRERAYIMLSFGLVNQQAQTNARVASGDFAHFSNPASLFSERSDNMIYATLEENFTKVDGSMLFPPRNNTSSSLYDTGLVGGTLVSNATYELTINLNAGVTNIKGLTVDFGENYPVDFDILTSSNQKIEIRNNTGSKFVTEEVFEDTTHIKLVVYRMKNPQSRLRIYAIKFGYGLVYNNDSVVSSSLDSYVSPIGADIPQIDFTVKLKNYDKYFNMDNPKSAINFFETGQEMEIYYGYQLPDSNEIEWIKGNHLLCSEWESDDYTATIRCQDVFRNMDSEYFKGSYNDAGRSYYDLATEILVDAGVHDYYIDPRLKTLYTKNPLPMVSHKEALQIIANACRCVLTQSRTGAIHIKSSFIPDVMVSANNKTEYSNVENILRTGYVSDEVSNEEGEFESNPIITVVQEAVSMYYGVKFVFGQSLPTMIRFRTYNSGELVEEYEVEGRSDGSVLGKAVLGKMRLGTKSSGEGNDEIAKTFVIHHDFADFDTMEIEFVKTAEPYSRIEVEHFSFGDTTDFEMTRTDMTSSPKAVKQELIKDIVVPCYSYKTGDVEENIVSEEIEVVAGDVVTFYVAEPTYNFRASVDGGDSNVSIIASGSYYVTVQFNVTGRVLLDIYGYHYKIVERHAVKTLNSYGRTVKWENPLMSDMAMASDLAEWLGDYYTSGVEYEYNTRGNPEIDVNDIVYQANEFRENMKVKICRHTLNFNQSFSGKVTARRMGG